MRSAPNVKAALAAIEEHGALLVYPIENRREPLSLWKVFHPRARMRWDWDESGDPRVVDLWALRERIARSRKVVYTKWYRGRATFFSRALFTAMLARYRATGAIRDGLADDALEILAELESDSPRSTKALRAAVGLRGKMFEASFQRSLKQLFARMLIVGFGEVEDGAFPSLALGATSTLFEDLWDEAAAIDPREAESRIERALPAGTRLRRHHDEVLRALARAPRGPALPSAPWEPSLDRLER